MYLQREGADAKSVTKRRPEKRPHWEKAGKWECTLSLSIYFFLRGGRSGEDGERGRGEDGWAFSAVRCGAVVLSGCVCNREEGGATTCEAPD